MMNFALAEVPFVMKVVVGIWIFASLVLVLVVLIQKGKGGGLSSTFGGLGTSLLGTKTGDFLTWFTICLVAVWLLLSVVASKWFKPQSSEYLQTMPRTSSPVMPAQQQTLPFETEKPVESEQPAAGQTTSVPQPNTPAN